MNQVRYLGFEASGRGEKWSERGMALLTLSVNLAGVVVCHLVRNLQGTQKRLRKKVNEPMGRVAPGLKRGGSALSTGGQIKREVGFCLQFYFFLQQSLKYSIRSD